MLYEVITKAIILVLAVIGFISIGGVITSYSIHYTKLYDVYIDDTAGCTLTDIRAKCRRLVMEEKNLGLIVIDYLQLMEGSGNQERIQQISAISRGLKTLARELDVLV